MEDIIVGLGTTMQNLSMAISNQGLGNVGQFIKSYNGDPIHFKEWIKSVEKYCLNMSFDDSNKIKVAFLTASGPVSDYISRWRESQERKTWDVLKEGLTKHFSDIANTDTARAMLRSIRQGPDEFVSAYSGRMYNIAKDAFLEVDPANAEAKLIIEREIINHFIDGLKHASVKYRIMRANPSTFDEASKLALEEQNLRRRFEVRNGMPIIEPRINHNRNHVQHMIPQAVPIRTEENMDISHLRTRRCPNCLREHRGQCRVTPVNHARDMRPARRFAEPLRFGNGGQTRFVRNGPANGRHYPSNRGARNGNQGNL